MQPAYRRDLIHFRNNGVIMDLFVRRNRYAELILFLRTMPAVYYEWTLDDNCWHRLARFSIKQMYMNIITSSDPLSEITLLWYQFEEMAHGGPLN